MSSRKHKPKRGPLAFIEKNVTTVDPEEFKFVLDLAQAAGSYRMPMENPATSGVNLQDTDGIEKVGYVGRRRVAGSGRGASSGGGSTFG